MILKKKYLDDQLSLSNSDSDKKQFKPKKAWTKNEFLKDFRRPQSAHRSSISKISEGGGSIASFSELVLD